MVSNGRSVMGPSFNAAPPDISSIGTSPVRICSRRAWRSMASDGKEIAPDRIGAAAVGIEDKSGGTLKLAMRQEGKAGGLGDLPGGFMNSRGVARSLP